MKIKVWVVRVLLLSLFVSIPMFGISIEGLGVYGAIHIEGPGVYGAISIEGPGVYAAIPLEDGMVYGSLPLEDGRTHRPTFYKDLDKTHWAYENISKLSETGLLKGYPDGSFRPSREVTYGEFIKMAVLCMGKKDPAKATNNNQQSHWALPYYQEGLIKGYYSKDRIGIGKLAYPIPRGDMALLLSKMLGERNIEDHKGILDKIQDVDYRNPDEYHFVKIYHAGILTGYPDGTFRPERTLNRAEAAAVISRFLDTKRQQLFPVPDPPLGKTLLPIENLIPNHVNDYMLMDVKSYWITDKDPYSYDIVYSLSGIETLIIFPEDRSRVVIFILGDKVIYTSDVLSTRYWVTGAKAGELLPDFDYIGVYERCSDTMMLIPSPFR
jgi:hypothetical protein